MVRVMVTVRVSFRVRVRNRTPMFAKVPAKLHVSPKHRPLRKLGCGSCSASVAVAHH